MNRIRNFVQLTGNFGTAGQPRADQFGIVADNGFRHVINIGMPDHADALPNEGELVSALGMNYLHIPVPFDKPEARQLCLFCNLLSQLRDERVFIHCNMNYRVSAFMYHYLGKVGGRAEADARSPMFEKWNPDPMWADLMSSSAADIGLVPGSGTAR